jgi:hypothetical protein
MAITVVREMTLKTGIKFEHTDILESQTIAELAETHEEKSKLESANYDGFDSVLCSYVVILKKGDVNKALFSL